MKSHMNSAQPVQIKLVIEKWMPLLFKMKREIKLMQDNTISQSTKDSSFTVVTPTGFSFHVLFFIFGNTANIMKGGAYHL